MNPTPHRSHYLKRLSAPLENKEAIPMKAFVAALIACGVLFVIDSEYNEGRYAAIIERAVTSVIPG